MPDSAPDAPAPPARQLELAGCHNFRDLGGYPVAGGGHTRWRTLFRADSLTRLTAADLEVLAGLGTRTVIDLRTTLEAETRGRFPAGHDGVRYLHLPLTATLPGEEESPAWDDDAFVAERYLAMLAEGAASLAEALRVLADPANVPAVFHCSVGKDRTGVFAAVVLGLLGVSDADIVGDYSLSAGPMARILDDLHLEFPDAAEIVERYAPVILAVPGAAMEGFLRGVRTRHGSFAGLASSLGVHEEVDRLRALMVDASSVAPPPAP